MTKLLEMLCLKTGLKALNYIEISFLAVKFTFSVKRRFLFDFVSRKFIHFAEVFLKNGSPGSGLFLGFVKGREHLPAQVFTMRRIRLIIDIKPTNYSFEISFIFEHFTVLHPQ